MRDAVLTIALAAVLGLAAVPLAARIFAVLPDRGVAFARPLALLALGYVTWVLAAVGVGPGRGLVVVLVLVGLAGGAWLWRRDGASLWADPVARRSLLVSEALFLAVCLAALLARAYMPDVLGNEKVFDIAVWTSAERADGLPPADPWASGFDLNYYYFGHWIAMIVSLPAGAPPWLAYNVATALWAGLVAGSAYAVSAGVGGALRRSAGPGPVVAAGLLGALLVAGIGNLESTRRLVLHDGPLASFDWFAPTRVTGGAINEFPLFSLILGDLHAHLLIVPFFLLAVGVALALALGQRGAAAFVPAAVCLAAMQATSTWSLPIAACLFAAGAAIGSERRTALSRLVYGALWAGAALVAGAVLALPFVLAFDAPVGGVGRADVPGRIDWFAADLLKTHAVGVWAAVGLLGGRLLLGGRRPHDLRWLAGGAVTAAVAWPLAGPSALLLIGAVFAIGVALDAGGGPALRFGGLLVAAGLVALVLPDVIYVKDYFDGGPNYRANTVFKFQYHAWLLLGVVGGAVGAAALARARRSVPALAWGVVLALLVLASLPYVFTGTYARTAGFAADPTLNGATWLAARSPGDVDAIAWMRREIDGQPVVLEAPGEEYGSAPAGRVSAYTGLPTPYIGPHHEMLQGRDLPRRAAEVDELFRTIDDRRALDLLRRYEVDYAFVGLAERERYDELALGKFERLFGPAVFASRGTAVYRIAR